ncbi:Uncharacterized mitochondrial protein AtMg01110 [Striga hermonthica]|uniref:Uncharacterized mitochondrial protein AtMg01110 n=1 Tax=Striga hermonthica TaxID=68872 RepID=A0A9N7MPE8_STRHE|nr:Uncharacterized mitochondrial protein AtMg01110 [Striga hermonthica]
MGIRPIPGRLCQVCSGDGKRRLFAIEQVYPGTRFDKYAILGDDIVITDNSVYQKYMSVVTSLGVEISKQKSLTSRTGAAEFAKRFRLKGLTVDVSPVSIRQLAASRDLFKSKWYSY